MKLSIITICYNDRAGFEKTAKSVTDQTYLDFEWIIVDGGSSDGSVDSIINVSNSMERSTFRFKDKKPLIRWKSEPDRGIYNAMNKGIKQARGQFCLFLNSGDVLYESRTLEKAISYLNDGNIYVGNQYESTDLHHTCVSMPRTSEGILYKIVFESFPHQSTFFRTSLFDKYGGYCEDMQIAADWYFYYNLIVLHGEKVQYIPEVISIFDKTGISSTNAEKGRSERHEKVSHQPIIHVLYKFYEKNYLVVTALHSSSWVYGIVYWCARIHHKIFKKRYAIR